MSIVKIGIAGSGTMGSGIAQVAAVSGSEVIVYDSNKEALSRAKNNITDTLNKLVHKEKLSTSEAEHISDRIRYADSVSALSGCDLLIEAIVENAEIKKQLFSQLENLVSNDCILASNTSSLSITSIASACRKPERVIGIHFFNPAPLMPLVEIIPGISTSDDIYSRTRDIITAWKKVPVKAKDTPGFIVNRIARPFYGEAIRIYEEGIAAIPVIDHAMKKIGGFRMGPFELMDLIGNDINFAVTETVWKQMFYDERYKPSQTQKRMVEAGRLGRKAGKGYYDYQKEINNEVGTNSDLHQYIFNRILVMLINEAADALHYGIANRDDIDLAMIKGVNYPKGLLAWCDEEGADKILATLDSLFDLYRESRYRASVALRNMVNTKTKFY